MMPEQPFYYQDFDDTPHRRHETAQQSSEILPLIHTTLLEDTIHQKRPIGLTAKGRIIIENLIFNTYVYVHYDDSKLLYARRTLCGFNIYTVKENKYVAHLKANVFGTKYGFEDGLEIRYETSFLQRGKPRSFTIKLGDLQLCNKKPYFNNDTNSFSLNFSGRITRPSVKNFQVIHPLEPTYITLTFGKEDSNTYILDYSYPWSALHAFCVGLAALDHKFGCD